MPDDRLFNTQRRPRGRPFVKGQSGNPGGRRAGCRNKATRAAELFLDGEAETLARKAVELALAGDPVALRLCLDRTIAPRRERPVPVPLPPIESVADIVPAMGAVAVAVAHGTITTAQAAELSLMVATLLRAVETGEFDRRLQAVEDGRSPAR